MAEAEAVAIESAADAETQKRAEAMGWIPPSRYTGPADRYVDADAFIERGETVLPIIKARLAEERETTKQLTARIASMEEAVLKSTKALEEIELRNSVATQKAVEAAKAQVKAELAKASEAGDHEAVAELTEQMVELNNTPPAAKEKEAPKSADAPAGIDPVTKAWVEDGNEWFAKDRRRSALAIAIATELRESGDKRVGLSFLNSIKDEVFKTLPLRESQEQHDKVDGGSRNGSEGDSRSGKKGYASLPADAKAACDSDAKQFVGPGKKYKDVAAWRQDYAALYFS